MESAGDSPGLPGAAEPPGVLITTDELAARLRTTPSTIRYWRHKGYGPVGFKAGRRVLYRVSDVDAWIDRISSDEPPS